ncbi:MAG TPA: hypothetical protein VMU40_12365 [Steroidobacteraceae bacterium]|nr:hypothetical protein [Steroidobacteraceae bacterium]
MGETAGTLSQLAIELELDPATLEKTVAAYIAFPLSCAITFAFGGVRTDSTVLRPATFGRVAGAHAARSRAAAG